MRDQFLEHLERLLDFLKTVAQCEDMAENYCEGCPVRESCEYVEQRIEELRQSEIYGTD